MKFQAGLKKTMNANIIITTGILTHVFHLVHLLMVFTKAREGAAVHFALLTCFLIGASGQGGRGFRIIREDFSEFEADVLDDDTLDLSDTLTLVSQYVDNLDSDVDKPRLNTLMKSLYIEAQEYDTI